VTLAASLPGNRILLHSPHSEERNMSPTTYLRVKQQVVALTAGVDLLSSITALLYSPWHEKMVASIQDAWTRPLGVTSFS
jgi:hypothetical protein